MSEQQTDRPRGWLHWGLLVALVLIIILAIRTLFAPDPEPASPTVLQLPRIGDSSTSSTAPPEPVAPAPPVAQEPSPAPADPEPQEVEAEQTPQLEGVHVFPPLGTNPILVGIVVPEDFELPRGYVRHYQTSDDGAALEPILMFHPRHQPHDWRGVPIPVTPDRIVPPEHAPRDMPIRMLEAPEPRERPEAGLQSLFNRRGGG